mmetsp:Transcript_121094/g.386735  ORF Transcript_121094/g.386735 Transcript_121094/m.386735 type:complete len:204 (-) Transcript_121094:398-1009(-)
MSPSMQPPSGMPCMSPLLMYHCCSMLDMSCCCGAGGASKYTGPSGGFRVHWLLRPSLASQTKTAESLSSFTSEPLPHVHSLPPPRSLAMVKHFSGRPGFCSIAKKPMPGLPGFSFSRPPFFPRPFRRPPRPAPRGPEEDTRMLCPRLSSQSPTKNMGSKPPVYSSSSSSCSVMSVCAASFLGGLLGTTTFSDSLSKPLCSHQL